MVRRFAALLVSCLATLNAMAADYDGFQIDAHLLDAGQHAVFTGAPSASVIAQLKIVESVGLPPAVLEGPDYLAFLAAQFGPHECHGAAPQGQP